MHDTYFFINEIKIKESASLICCPKGMGPKYTANGTVWLQKYFIDGRYN